MGLTGLTPWPRPPAGAMAAHHLAPLATHHSAANGHSRPRANSHSKPRDNSHPQPAREWPPSNTERHTSAQA